MKLAPSIHRIGEKSIVNAYLVEEAGEVTIADIPRELAAMGRSMADVRALVLDEAIRLVRATASSA